MDVLAYSYDDLKSFHLKEVQHDIPLNIGATPFRQKQRCTILKSQVLSFPRFKKCERSDYFSYPSFYMGRKYSFGAKEERINTYLRSFLKSQSTIIEG